MKKCLKLISFAFILVCAISVYADSFYLKNTKTLTEYGPFSNDRGTRFDIEGKHWCVMSARPGQILLADYPATTYYGPYDFKNGHIIKLGVDVFEFFNITPEIVNDPTANAIIKKATATNIAAPNSRINIASPKASQTPAIAIADTPQLQKRELAPAPSTNPAAYKEPELFDFKMEHNPLPRTGQIWVEPINSSKYNWGIGGFNGEKNSEIKRQRIGVSANYNGWFAEAAYSISGKSSGKLVPDGSTLSDLKLDGGNGYMLRGGYKYRFTIDGNWNGSFKVAFEYAKEDYDLTATAFQKINNSYKDIYDDEGVLIENVEEDSPLISFGYVDTTSSISISEKTLYFGFGIDRTSDIWGIGVELGFVAYSDLSSNGSVIVGLNEYKLDAERSHPILCEFNAWFKPVDFLFVFGEVYLGSDTGLRLGIGNNF